MATESDLKNSYRDMEATADEMDRYRGRLMDTLAAEGNNGQRKRSRGPAIWRRPTFYALAASVLFAIILVTYSLGGSTFPQQDYDELQAIIRANDPNRLHQLAQKVSNNSNLDGLNAIMVLALTSTPEYAVEMALRGLELDPRKDFRREYLEILLDNSEQVTIDPNYLETVMENEVDETSLELYALLLKFS